MRRNRGFTLIEVLVALALGALVVLLAERLYAGVADTGRALRAARLQLDRMANAHRWLASTLLSVEVGTNPGEGFSGSPDEIAFAAWEETPEGWFVRHRITVTLADGQLVAGVTGRQSVVLADSVTDIRFDYLLQPGSQTPWVQHWVSGVTAPIAVRMRVTRRTRADTALFLIKARG